LHTPHSHNHEAMQLTPFVREERGQNNSS
jgi:hypothetical protein